MAFKKSSGGGGMSIVLMGCAESNSGSVCAHISNYYKNVGGDPPVFYIMDESELPQGSTIKQTPSGSGDDDCHYEVDGVSQSKMKGAFAAKLDWQLYFTCDGVDTRTLTLSDVENFSAA